MKITKPKNAQEKEILSQVLMLDHEIRRRESVGHPGNYGMPDLLFPKGFKQGYYASGIGEDPVADLAGKDLQDGWVRETLDHEETDEEYAKRQNLVLNRFITESLFIVKDGRKIYVRTIPQQLDFIADIFFKRVSKVILWKPRGGGGSLSAAVLIWLLVVYRKVSVLDLAGSADQAKIVYDYVKEFWDCVPGLSVGLIDGDPLSQITRLTTGAEVKCVPSTERQARGKHYSVIFVDEACQRDPRPEAAMRAAIQGALSEYNPVIVLLSTFHVPHGMFQEYWDDYENKGFSRYKWSCLDTKGACYEGMDSATEDDPKALEYCKTCFLTEKKMIKDISGQFETETFVGCNGHARDAKGWMTFNSICEQKKLNLGTTIFECEFLCLRPQYSAAVYPPELIENAMTEPLTIDPETDRLAVGIDWGIQTAGSLAINMIARMVDYVYVAEIVYADHKLVSDVADLLNGWREQFGNFPVLADASHPFNNAELSEAGFDIRPISFGSWKRIGIENVSKFFVFNRLRINKNLDILIDQLKRFRRNETTGNVVKKEDHGPDSLMVSLLNFRFEDEFGPDIAQAAVLEQQTRLLENKKLAEGKKDKVSFSNDGVAPIVTVVPDFVPQEAIAKKERQKNILVF